jgi:gliding motility-associated-like protein
VTESFVQAAFTASMLTGNAPVEIAFTNTSLPVTAAFDWDFADGDGSSAVHPVHAFTEEGLYTVTLTAVNADGCTDVASLLITVTGLPAALEVPNVFTPNGDQTNDVFTVSAERIAAYHILIFNRWGNTVAESDDVLMAWDGTLNGEPVSEGTYFYRIAATGTDGKSYDKTGFFELVR